MDIRNPPVRLLIAVSLLLIQASPTHCLLLFAYCVPAFLLQDVRHTSADVGVSSHLMSAGKQIPH